MTFHFESWVFVDNLTASNRTRVLRLLLQTFNLHIVDMSKAGLEQFVKATSRLLERGYTHQAPRIHMDPPLLQELLFGAYVCMYNGFQVGKSLNIYFALGSHLWLSFDELVCDFNSAKEGRLNLKKYW